MKPSAVDPAGRPRMPRWAAFPLWFASFCAVFVLTGVWTLERPWAVAVLVVYAVGALVLTFVVPRRVAEGRRREQAALGIVRAGDWRMLDSAARRGEAPAMARGRR